MPGKRGWLTWRVLSGDEFPAGEDTIGSVLPAASAEAAGIPRKGVSTSSRVLQPQVQKAAGMFGQGQEIFHGERAREQPVPGLVSKGFPASVGMERL